MTLSSNINDLALRMATEAKSLRTLMNGNAPDNSALATAAKSNLVAAINELVGTVNALSGSAATIDDSSTGAGAAWSASKVRQELDALRNALVGGASAALDTIEELAAALNNDPNIFAGITTALGKRVRVDAAQVFSAPEQAQGRANIGAASSAEVGNTNTNYVQTFENGL